MARATGAGAAGRVTRTSLETQPLGCGGEAELEAAASLASTSIREVRPGLVVPIIPLRPTLQLHLQGRYLYRGRGARP